jgi:hypothetical protein
MYEDEPESEFEHTLGEESQREREDLAEIEADLAEVEAEEHDPFLTDAEADADALASAGWGTDEDYGCFDGGCDEF